MDVSAEAADVVVRESLQATEAAAKLTLEGVKNVAALLLAIAKQDMKVVGQTTAKRLARDPAPAVVIPIKAEDKAKFQKLAKEFGVLYFSHRKRGTTTGCSMWFPMRTTPPCSTPSCSSWATPFPKRNRRRTRKKSEVPRSTKEILARAREWLETVSDDCGGC